MVLSMNYSLQARLKECLKTILDFEFQLEQHDAKASFVNELALLRDFVQKIDALTLSEEEVARIEMVTENFLLEFAHVPFYNSLRLVQ